jgi:surface antigen
VLHKILVLSGLLILSVAVSDALAKPPWARDDDGYRHDKGHDKGKWKQKRHKRHKHWRGRVVYFRGGPPPWAPAHGYRRKHRHSGHYVVRGRYATPYGIDRGTCHRDKIGMVIGGVAGAALGSQFGKGDGRIAATILGTVAGVVIGGQVGRGLDRADETCVGQALEHAPTGRAVRWTNPDTGARYAVTPRETFQQDDGRYCREYTADASVGGRSERVTGTACRQADGSWKIVS